MAKVEPGDTSGEPDFCAGEPQIRSSIIVAVLSSDLLAAEVSRAARLARIELRLGPPKPCPEVGWPDVSRALLVHDFAPDPAASAAWLDTAHLAGCRFTVFALLSRPATPALDLLCHVPRHFELSGMAVAGDEDARGLARRLTAALAYASRSELADLVVSACRLPPALARLARSELTSARPHATLAGLLRDSGLGRKQFVRMVHGSGFFPPLRFLHGLRVLEAADLLRHGSTIQRAVHALGYGSAETLRRQFRTVMGGTPSQARELQPRELALRCLGGAATASDGGSPALRSG
ncbi:MAG TPA: helix-turn-helix domain-containing protein [Longimicrobium sp.]